MDKRCARCETTKPIEDFPLDRSNPDGRYAWCRLCKAEYMRTYPDRVPEGRAAWSRRRNLWRKYGLTVEQYDALLAEQGGGCAICGTSEPTGNHGALVVDHDHETGRVRGLLCGSCNGALGLLGDDAATVAAAHAYLLRNTAEVVDTQDGAAVG